MVIQAKENLILRREIHLDQLADKLQEPRVRSVIEPLLTGTPDPGKMLEDDLPYIVDLGLVRRKPQRAIRNPIYQEIIPRMLTETTQDVMPFESHGYLLLDGRLDMEKLLSAFQQFFREHSERWVEHFDYKEAGPPSFITGIFTAYHQFRWTYRPGIRVRAQTHGFADDLAAAEKCH